MWGEDRGREGEKRKGGGEPAAIQIWLVKVGTDTCLSAQAMNFSINHMS